MWSDYESAQLNAKDIWYDDLLSCSDISPTSYPGKQFDIAKSEYVKRFNEEFSSQQASSDTL